MFQTINLLFIIFKAVSCGPSPEELFLLRRIGLEGTAASRSGRRGKVNLKLLLFLTLCQTVPLSNRCVTVLLFALAVLSLNLLWSVVLLDRRYCRAIAYQVRNLKTNPTSNSRKNKKKILSPARSSCAWAASGRPRAASSSSRPPTPTSCPAGPTGRSCARCRRDYSKFPKSIYIQ